MNRDASTKLLREHTGHFDVVIIGGGATGLGAAVDAASRGHQTLLIEKSDFAQSTSSRSTKLIHGGVRYLQQGNVSLVRDSLKERGLLKKNAPHLVSRQAFVIPTYKWWERPFYGIGLTLYDILAGKLSLGKSRRLSKVETLEQLPNLNPKNLVGGILYYDGQFDDARLAITLACTANQMGATLINYMECLHLTKTNGKVDGIEARDIETGELFKIKAKSVINATGVRVDTLRQKDEEGASKIIAPSQGIHFVLPKKFLPGNAALMIPKTNDGRVLFAVPWKNRVLLGTTDTPVDSILDEPKAFQEEKEFLFEHAAKYLEVSPKPEEILSIYAGLRPLVSIEKSSSTSSISRDHTIIVSKSGLITIAGGKWTTFRKMGEDVVNQAEITGKLIPRKCITESLPLKGTANQLDDDIYHTSPYGTNLKTIEAIQKNNPDSSEKIHPDLPYTVAEIIYHIENELARTVDDLLARRTRSLILNAQASIEAAPRVAKILGERLGKDDLFVEKQIMAFNEVASNYLSNTDKYD